MTEPYFCQNDKDVLTVKLPRDVDHHIAKELRFRIDDQVMLKRPKQLILDLTDTQFMDSSGLGLILGRARLTKEMKVDYLVLNPNPATKKLLSMAGVDQMLKIQSL